jgi:iron complex outermembrane receptor protein
VLWAYELGYRIQPNPRLSVDLAAFYNDYDRLLSRRPTGTIISAAPLDILPFEYETTLHGATYGGEAVFTIAASAAWRLSASYSLLLMDMRGEPSSAAASLESNTPTHQAVLRAAYDFTRHVSLDAQLRYVDNVQSVPAYLTADVRLSWRPTDDLELSLVGQNLFDDQHPEQASTIGLPTVEVPRGFYGKLTWRF